MKQVTNQGRSKSRNMSLPPDLHSRKIAWTMVVFLAEPVITIETESDAVRCLIVQVVAG